MKNQLLSILIETEDYVSGQALAEQLGVSRQAVWKTIKALREDGCVINSVNNKGYKLLSLPDSLNEAAIRKHLHTAVIGKELVVLDSVGSTNDYLKRMGDDECPNGTVVVTREQTKGKGRMGREWSSKRDENIAFSFLLRPSITPQEVGVVTPLAGLAVCKALREFTGLDLKIKWPNDVILGKKKLVGILTEMSAEFDAVEYLVIGVGINVDQVEFPENIAHKASSVLLETGRHYDKNELLACVINHLEEEFTVNRLEFSAATAREYSSLCATISRSVTFHRGTRSISGVAVGVNLRGELRVMLSDGSICNVNSGEVTVQGIY